MRHIIHVNPPPSRPSNENYEFATHAGSDLPKRPEEKPKRVKAGD